ncbi:unnamed protein product [Phytomonas sp. Hart1]|nr:unnamed protein product [Phytomonas sp. Hart1]|eukprot:CCW70700.1 unnamed protein product [Phytomonas sp. isolate Hart1]
MPPHPRSSPIQQLCLEGHVRSPPVSDLLIDPLVSIGSSGGGMCADTLAKALVVIQQQGDTVSNSTQCTFASLNKQGMIFEGHPKPELELEHSDYSLGLSDRVCGDCRVVSNVMHSQAYRDLSPFENSDSCTRSSYIPSRFHDLFGDSELQVYRREALSDYIIMKNKIELRDFFINERIIREEIDDVAFSQFQAIHTRFWEESSKFSMLADASGQLLMKLQNRLQRSENFKEAKSAEWEARLLAEGRCAWQEEVKSQEEKAREEVERSKQKKAEENQFRAAVVFIICRERTDRGLFEKEIEAAWNKLFSKEADERKEAEQLAYERFMNSPEQLALAAERERKALKERKRKARFQKILQAEQKRIIDRCHHGRNGTSLLENPGPQKSCCRCRICFDENLGYYVNIDAKNSSSNPLKRKHILSTAVSSGLPNTSKRK